MSKTTGESSHWLEEYKLEAILTAANVLLHILLFIVSHSSEGQKEKEPKQASGDHTSPKELHLPPPQLLYAYDCLLVECIVLQLLGTFKLRKSMETSEEELRNEIGQLKADFVVLDELEKSREHDGPFIDNKRREILADISSLAGGTATIRSISDVYSVDRMLIDKLNSGDNLFATVPSFDQLEINYLDPDFESLFDSILKASVRGVNVKRLYYLDNAIFENITVKSGNDYKGYLSLSSEDSQFYYFDREKNKKGLALFYDKFDSGMLMIVPSTGDICPIAIVTDDLDAAKYFLTNSHLRSVEVWTIESKEVIKTLRHFYLCNLNGIQVRWHFSNTASDEFNNDYVLFGNRVLSVGSIRPGASRTPYGREFHAKFTNSPPEISRFERRWPSLWNKAAPGISGLYLDLPDLVELKRNLLENSKTGLQGHIVAGDILALSRNDEPVSQALNQYCTYIEQKIKSGFSFEQVYFIAKDKFNACLPYLQKMQQLKASVKSVPLANAHPPSIHASVRSGYSTWNCLLMDRKWFLRCLVSSIELQVPPNSNKYTVALTLLTSDETYAGEYNKWFNGVDCKSHPSASSDLQGPKV